MSARNYVRAGLYQKRIDRGRDVHLNRVDRASKKTVDAEKRKQRFNIIRKRGIEKGKGEGLPNGINSLVKLIKPDGIIMLDDWNIIDPLNLE